MKLRITLLTAATLTAFSFAAHAAEKGTIMIMVNSLDNPYYASEAKGASEKAQALGYKTTVLSHGEDVKKQNELIDDTREKFNAMGEAVELLMKDINVAEESIKKILDSTTVISDNITHLSATGEEVAASSTEGLRMADTTVESMAKCKKVLENIYMLADDLKNSVEENEEELSQKFDF